MGSLIPTTPKLKENAIFNDLLLGSNTVFYNTTSFKSSSNFFAQVHF